MNGSQVRFSGKERSELASAPQVDANFRVRLVESFEYGESQQKVSQRSLVNDSQSAPDTGTSGCTLHATSLPSVRARRPPDSIPPGTRPAVVRAYSQTQKEGDKSARPSARLAAPKLFFPQFLIGPSLEETGNPGHHRSLSKGFGQDSLLLEGLPQAAFHMFARQTVGLRLDNPGFVPGTHLAGVSEAGRKILRGRKELAVVFRKIAHDPRSRRQAPFPFDIIPVFQELHACAAWLPPR